jgi:carotenoid 1,2-hydratase
VLTWQGPRLLESQTLSAELTFTPHFRHAPAERVFLSRKVCGAEHHWVVANPLCSVTGSIECGGQKVEFRGRGYHDHNYGTAPLGPGLRRWIWGRVLFGDDSVATFHFAQARDDALEDEVHLIEADATGLRETPIATVEADWSRRTGALLQYPEKLRLENALWLSNPRLIDSSPFYLRLTYDAQRGDRRGTALCEIAYPHRLRIPVLGRMIELSIDKRAVLPTIS